jgi:endogenous inhibitor of DNA gyrase (YacG/DUF329 family)
VEVIMKKKFCEQCGKPIEPKRSHGRFCSPLCRLKRWNIKHPRIGVKSHTGGL